MTLLMAGDHVYGLKTKAVLNSKQGGPHYTCEQCKCWRCNPVPLLAPQQCILPSVLILIEMVCVALGWSLLNDGMRIGALESKGTHSTSQAAAATAVPAACRKHARLLPGHLELPCPAGRLQGRSHMRIDVP